jgi:hypothetical protein
MEWATFWATFSQNCPVTLLHDEQSFEAWGHLTFLGKKQIARKSSHTV